MTSRKQMVVFAVLLLALSAEGQVSSRTGGPISSQAATPATPITLVAAAPNNVSAILGQIQSVANATTSDLNQLNIRKWKVGNDVKSDAETKSEAVRRNLTTALPEILGKVQASPDDFAAGFKLYRNLGVLYDVMSSLAESAGAFGSKPEFENLAADLNRIDQARRALGDRLESLAGAKDQEIVRLQSQVRAARAAASATPKKIVVDEENSDKAKKPVKKTTKKKPTENPPAPDKQPQ